METNKAYITLNGFIRIKGEDSIDFIQNIISNNIKKVTDNNCIFSSLLTPQGKFLFEFTILKINNYFLIECNTELIKELFNKLLNYKLRSKVEIQVENDLISIDIPFIKFENLNINKFNVINYKNYIIFEDPRIKNTLARAVVEKSKIKEFLNDLNIELSNEKYLLEKKLFNLGIPSKDIIKLQNQIFSLEANFLELNGIDQKKGCYIGQENTARMYLKNKVNKRLFALQTISGIIKEGQKITLDNEEIGKVL
ncbi:MAG: folate-binding protein YgfZ, partial [Proteobacteria bacterium]|nr:folate-binding protein YgfZ [Pseudomonadota bacterium]